MKNTFLLMILCFCANHTIKAQYRDTCGSPDFKATIEYLDSLLDARNGAVYEEANNISTPLKTKTLRCVHFIVTKYNSTLELLYLYHTLIRHYAYDEAITEVENTDALKDLPKTMTEELSIQTVFDTVISQQTFIFRKGEFNFESKDSTVTEVVPRYILQTKREITSYSHGELLWLFDTFLGNYMFAGEDHDRSYSERFQKIDGSDAEYVKTSIKNCSLLNELLGTSLDDWLEKE